MDTPQETANKNSCKDIEGAINNIEQFARPNKSLQIPIFCHLDIENGQLKSNKLSTLGKTILFAKDCLIRLFSEKKDNERIAHQKAIKGTLLKSIDLIKIYSSAIDKMLQGSTEERQLATRLEHCAFEYNSIISKAKENQFSLVTKVKKFFLNIAGWDIAEDTSLHEIHLPRASFQRHDVTVNDIEHSFGHKLANDRHQDLSKKISLLLKSVPTATDFDPFIPRQSEIDALKMKSLLFLQRHIEFCHLSLREIIDLVQSTKVCPYTTNEHPHNIKEPIIAIRQTFSCFPGETAEFVGCFQRDVKNPQLSLPLKHSFKGTTHTLCSGFCAPIQHFGFAFSEKLLPSFLLNPNLAPKLNDILAKRQKIIQKLRVGETLNLKAKVLLKSQIETIESHKSTFFQKLQNIVQNMIDLSEDIQDKELAKSFISDFYTQSNLSIHQISNLHSHIIDTAILQPFGYIQEGWILQKLPELSNENPELAKKACILIFENHKESALQKFATDSLSIELKYEKVLIVLYFEIARNLQTMQLSEHFFFKADTLSKLSFSALLGTIYQQQTFLNELEELETASHPQVDATELLKILENESSIFSPNLVITDDLKESSSIADEILSYFLLN